MEIWHTVLASIVSAISIVGTIFYVINRFAKLELKVDTLWDYLMRRAMSETVTKGLGSIHSPVKFTDETRSWYAGMVEDLKKYYRLIGYRHTDRELFMEIEAR